MRKKISSRLVSLIFSILVICFAVGFYIYAWTEPGASPPGGNVPAPLNVSNIAQTKIGGLLLNWGTDGQAGGALNGLIVAQGNVGIGTTGPQTKLHISGGSLTIQAGEASGITLTQTGANDLAISKHLAAGYGIWIRGTRARGMDASGGVSSNLGIYVNSVEQVTIDTSGNVGIGTTSPGTYGGEQAQLDVADYVAVDDVYLKNPKSGASPDWASNLATGFSDIVIVTCDTTNPDQITGECTALCPAGYQVIAGGCEAFETHWQVKTSKPVSGGWYCEIQEDHGSQIYWRSGKGYAMCVK